MGFYNLQGPRTQIDPAGEHPQGTHNRGGTKQAQATTVTAGTSVALLGAPPAGFEYSIHRMTHSFPAGVTSAAVIGFPSGFVYSEANNNFSDQANGLLCSEVLVYESFGAGGAHLSMAYDLVISQSID
jgi:hypothetical protein